MLIETPQWFLALVTSDGPLSSKVLMEAYAGLREVYTQCGASVVDELLSSVNVSHCHTEGLVALIRYSYPMKETLRSWGPFLEKTQQELKDRGIETDQVY